jgi:hypothetical protein
VLRGNPDVNGLADRFESGEMKAAEISFPLKPARENPGREDSLRRI